VKQADSETLYSTILNALDLYNNIKLWQQLCKTAMRQELGWDASAHEYQKLYQAEVDAKK